jgi:hypothetical protein
MGSRDKKESSDKEVVVSKKATKARGGLCCPHCADSKYPCVTMEKQMRKGEKAAEKREKGEKTD